MNSDLFHCSALRRCVLEEAFMNRRNTLKSGLILIGSATLATLLRPVGATSQILSGGRHWATTDTLPPAPVNPGLRLFFDKHEATQVKAIFDRLIPADELSISASEAGCVVFIDHQLAGDYGKGRSRFQSKPFVQGTPEQGDQTPLAPADIYRRGLAELDKDCRYRYEKSFSQLPEEIQDQYLEQLEASSIPFSVITSGAFFSLLLANVREGFLADPVYGGNKDMVGWKMIGFPGAHYDYRDVVALKGQPLDIPPVSLVGRI
ncbi:gluconate 2-dehydrogenase subunit 3 family protein [Pseudomonas nicosulfuronedens]